MGTSCQQAMSITIGLGQASSYAENSAIFKTLLLFQFEQLRILLCKANSDSIDSVITCNTLVKRTEEQHDLTFSLF